jgi:hypothetical protein
LPPDAVVNRPVAENTSQRRNYPKKEAVSLTSAPHFRREKASTLLSLLRALRRWPKLLNTRTPPCTQHICLIQETVIVKTLNSWHAPAEQIVTKCEPISWTTHIMRSRLVNNPWLERWCGLMLNTRQQKFRTRVACLATTTRQTRSPQRLDTDAPEEGLISQFVSSLIVWPIFSTARTITYASDPS